MLQVAQYFIQRLGLADEEGQGMIEYVLIAGLISVVAIATIILVGGNVTNLWTAMQTALGTAPGS